MRRPGRTLGHLLALSRAPHALLDVATPAVAALLWTRGFPPTWVILLGLPTALAGYLAVYATNDLSDIRADRRKMDQGLRDATGYLDAALVRHPVAAGLLPKGAALLWAGILAALAAVGGALLNPACLGVFASALFLEFLYCRLGSVTCLRALVAGVVKTLGPVAAVYAVDRSPRLPDLALLAAWLFLFEIGGQNIPNDWTDLAEDRRTGARTLPLALGERAAGWVSLGALAACVAAGLAVVARLDPPGSAWIGGLTVAAGLVLLVLPAALLVRAPDRSRVFRLFNRASLYPAAVLAVTGVVLVVAAI